MRSSVENALNLARTWEGIFSSFVMSKKNQNKQTTTTKKNNHKTNKQKHRKGKFLLNPAADKCVSNRNASF